VTAAVPAVWIKLAGTTAVSCVELTNVVANAEAFQYTVAPRTNPFPLTIKVKAGWPAITTVGFSEVIVGAAAVIVPLYASVWVCGGLELSVTCTV
jgi:hypothetical protein